MWITQKHQLSDRNIYWIFNIVLFWKEIQTFDLKVWISTVLTPHVEIKNILSNAHKKSFEAENTSSIRILLLYQKYALNISQQLIIFCSGQNLCCLEVSLYQQISILQYLPQCLFMLKAAVTLLPILPCMLAYLKTVLVCINMRKLRWFYRTASPVTSLKCVFLFWNSPLIGVLSWACTVYGWKGSWLRAAQFGGWDKKGKKDLSIKRDIHYFMK